MSELEHEVGILRAEKLKLRNEIARLSQQTQHSQPQLTIPQSIADLLDEELLNPLKRVPIIETFVFGFNFLVLSDELMKFVLTGDNYHIICVYLSGKALGVDLVKVVEG